MKNKEVIKESKKGNKGGTDDLYSNEQGNVEDKKDDAKENKSKKETSKDGKEPRDVKSLRAKFQLRRDKNHALKFEGEGITFKAKMIGIEKVDDARGDRMCQDSLQRLKAAVKLTGEHKQRILLVISLDGIRIKDEKTGEELYHHPVHKISFISQDIGDARAFGYVFGAPHSGHEFFAIKTEKSASNVVIALRDLFQMVLQIKKQEIEKVKQQQENTDSFQTEEKNQVIRSNTCETAMGEDSNISQEEPVYADIISLSEEERPCSPKLPYSSVSSSSREMNTVDSLLDFQFEVDCLQQGIAQIDSSIAAAAAINSSFDMELPFPPLSNPLLAATQTDHVASSHQQDISTSELAVGASPSQSIASISDSKDTPISENGNMSDSITNETSKDSSSNAAVEDRYAVFSDLDSLPSIFDNPHIVEIPTSHNEVQENNDCLMQEQSCEEDEDALSNDIPSFPPPVLLRSPKSLNTTIFADLDPLRKNRYVDKKDFFQELKNPPKKVLKDLTVDDLDNELSFIEFSHSPRSSISDSSAGFASVCSNNSNPFRSELEDCSPPPQLPPKQFSVNNDSDYSQDFHENVSWEVSSSPSHSPFNPFIASCIPNFPPPSTPPPPPPPPRLPARGSEPLFQTAPSPPPRPPSRNCATPTPPLPRRKITQSNNSKLRNYASVEDSWNNKYSSISNGDTFSPPLPLPARKPPLPCRTNSPLLGSNSPFSTRRHLTRSPASIDTDSPITSLHFSKNSCLTNETNSLPLSEELNSPQRATHQKTNNVGLTSSSSSLPRVNNSCETAKQLHTANGASSTFSQLPSPPLPSRPPQRSLRTFITCNNVSNDSLHTSNSSISPAKNGIINNQEEKISKEEHKDIVNNSENKVSIGSASDCSVPSIFCRKSDPFDDDFFTTLPKKVSSQSKNQCEVVKTTIHDGHECSSNTGEG